MPKNKLSRFRDIILTSAAVAIAVLLLILVLTACNTSRQLHSNYQKQDTTALHAVDSVVVTSNRTEDRQTNENIKEWVFGMLQSQDKNGQPITNVYPTNYREIFHNTVEKIAEQKDSTHLQAKDSVSHSTEQAMVDKKSSTKVFPMWWLVAIGAGALVVGNITGRFKITKR